MQIQTKQPNTKIIMTKYKLSKSSFLKGAQCIKSIFLHYKFPELRTPMTFEQRVIVDKGIEVGLIARDIFRGGLDVTEKGKITFPELLDATKTAFKSDNQILYEAGFATEDLTLRFQADIFVRSEKTDRLYEVKSATSIKLPEHILDIAFQYYVLKESGYNRPVQVYLVYLNKDYVRDKELDLDKLFIIENVTQRAKDAQVLIRRYLELIDKTVNKNNMPTVSIGEQCFKPYPCEFQKHCWRNVPEYSVFDIGHIRKTKAFKLYNNGIVEPQQIPRNTKLNDKQWTEIDSAIAGKASINFGEIKKFLHGIEGPKIYMDFESVMPGIPKYEGNRPYQQLCFQYSLIQQNDKGDQIRKEFLADHNKDPRKEFIENLLHDTEEPGHIIVYNKNFEQTRLQDLANTFPEYAEEIEERINRIKDLMEIFAKKYYYHFSFKGKHSIKVVLPHLVPELRYSDLTISNGAIAMAKYEALEKLPLKGQIETRRALLQYCYLDVYAMLKIVEALQKIILNK
jgi:hypothetical protein